MRRTVLTLVLAASLLAPVLAQPQEGGALRRELKELALEAAEIDAIEKIIDRDSVELARAAGEIKILQARLERLMIEKSPPLEEIQKLVRSSLEWEYAIRMARIERSLALRRLLGDRRWAALERIVRGYVQAKRAGKLKELEGGEAGPRILGLLDRLEW